MNTLKEYEQRKNKLSGSTLKPVLMRVGILFIVLTVLLIYPELIPNPTLRYGVIILAGVLPSIITSLTTDKLQQKEKLDLLKLEYEKKVVCPKCNYCYINTSSTYLKAKKKCFNKACDATFSLD